MENYCQSCGMGMQKAEEFGTNKDGSKNNEYCKYCFENGEFTSDCTMDEMIEQCLEFVDEFNKDSEKKYSKEEARIEMKKFFPNLKRWNK